MTMNKYIPYIIKVGVTMSQVVLEPSMLEECVRDVLNTTAKRFDGLNPKP